MELSKILRSQENSVAFRRRILTISLITHRYIFVRLTVGSTVTTHDSVLFSRDQAMGSTLTKLLTYAVAAGTHRLRFTYPLLSH